ncbi:Transposase IS200 like protein [Planctomycetes bacterium CA13]|uniref:Transposase IS200 like protein n=1 Tax=Novipirellula herctigrandis TaxID=2527986 RepID=A0A5C5YZD1_9BACT|nr:Transposase IS200 like protein [Planctomycetes bacterium CA13]
MSTFTNLLFHIIYSTKYRKPAVCADWQDDLYGYIGGIVRDQKGTLLRIGGVEDHVHLLAKLSPTVAISDVLRTIKANSSKWINERSDVSRKFEWQSGYAAFSVSESQMPVVGEYIANQAEHHRKATFEEEFLAILKKHNIKFDMRYVFEKEVIA